MHLNSMMSFFWSDFVKEEFDNKYVSKLNNISNFFFDLKKNLEDSGKEFYSSSDLMKYATNNYSGRMMDDAKKSVNPFWNQYIGIESVIPFNVINKMY